MWISPLPTDFRLPSQTSALLPRVAHPGCQPCNLAKRCLRTRASGWRGFTQGRGMVKPKFSENNLVLLEFVCDCCGSLSRSIPIRIKRFGGADAAARIEDRCNLAQHSNRLEARPS